MPLIRSKPHSPPAPEPDAAASLTSESASLRWAAARTAADGSASIADLASALAVEADPRVREAIFTALAQIGTPDCAESALPYLRSNDASIRTSAFDALCAMPEAAAPYLKQLLADADADVRLIACEMSRSVGEDASRLLLDLISTESHPNVCAAAVEVLAEIGDAQSLPALAQLAARLPDDPFLDFAVRVASDRLCTKPSGSRG